MLFMLTLAGMLFAQAMQAPDSWTIAWRDAVDSNGRPSRLPVFIWAGAEPPATGGRYTVRPEFGFAVRRDEDFRQARTNADAATIARILDDTYHEATADGTARDKRAAIENLVAVKPDAVSLERSSARLVGSAVEITAIERTTVGSNVERIVATRAYSRDARGEWRLISSTLRPVTVSAAHQEGKPPAGEPFIGVWAGSWDGAGGGGGFELTVERDKDKDKPLVGKVSVTGEPTYKATLTSIAFDGAKMTGKYDFPEDAAAEVLLTATFEEKSVSGTWSLREKASGNELVSGTWTAKRTVKP